MGQLIKFSLGKTKYDNQPEQHECVSADDFFELLLSDRSPQKHLKYICGPFITGEHDNPEKYPGEKTWRLKVLALPRCFLAFDVDECRSQEDFLLFREYCKKWQCLIYTTASHKPEAPRFRAIVMLSKELAPSECESLGRVIEQEFKMALGLKPSNLMSQRTSRRSRSTRPYCSLSIGSFMGNCLRSPIINIFLTGR